MADERIGNTTITDDGGDKDHNIFREQGRTDVANQVATSPDNQTATSTIPQQADPSLVAPAAASGGMGDPTDGTQVPHHVPTAVPGKPMAPIADGDGTDGITPTLDTPASSPHAERGGSG